jgi:hypothetical protein
MLRNPKLRTSINALDAFTVSGRSSASLLTVWGGLEQLFAPSQGELRFRTAAYISSYLEDAGPRRYKLYREVLQLYNDRSSAAHSAKESEIEPLVQSWIILRNAVIRMIDDERIPDQQYLEKKLFGV